MNAPGGQTLQRNNEIHIRKCDAARLCLNWLEATLISISFLRAFSVLIFY